MFVQVSGGWESKLRWLPRWRRILAAARPPPSLLSTLSLYAWRSRPLGLAAIMGFTVRCVDEPAPAPAPAPARGFRCRFVRRPPPLDASSVTATSKNKYASRRGVHEAEYRGNMRCPVRIFPSGMTFCPTTSAVDTSLSFTTKLTSASSGQHTCTQPAQHLLHCAARFRPENARTYVKCVQAVPPGVEAVVVDGVGNKLDLIGGQSVHTYFYEWVHDITCGCRSQVNLQLAPTYCQQISRDVRDDEVPGVGR